MGFKEKATKLAKDFPSSDEVEFIPSGSVIMDAILGGGVPLGTYIEIASASGLGKSTAALHMSKIACSLGRGVIYLDYEQGVNKSQIDGIGLSDYRDELFFLYHPVTYKDGEKIINKLADEEELAYIIIDSVTSMLPESMRDKSVEDIQPALQARLATKFLLKYKYLARRNNVSFIFINQMRTKLNFRGTSSTKAAGGNAQKFFSDIRLRMGEKKKLEKTENTLEGEKKIPYGAHVGLWAIKNRYERPYIEATMTVIYGKGISNVSAYYRWLIKSGLIKKKGAGWYEIYMGKEDGEDPEKVRGEESLKKWVKENMDNVKEYIKEEGGFLLIADEKDIGGE